MTGRELKTARQQIGQRWGIGRPLRQSELARVLQLSSGQTISQYESGRFSVPGPVAVAVEMMCDGSLPRCGVGGRKP